jgi:subtilase family serine protease
MFRRTPRHPRQQKSPFRPQLETLECRELLSTGLNGGFTAAQIQQAYGIDKIPGLPHQLPDTFQTIAIYEVGYDAKFVNGGDPTFATSDLAVFDQAMNLPDPPGFTVLGYNPETGAILQGSARSQNAAATASHEYALDVEWAHAAAPGANIVVVEEVPLSGRRAGQPAGPFTCQPESRPRSV